MTQPQPRAHQSISYSRQCDLMDKGAWYQTAAAVSYEDFYPVSSLYHGSAIQISPCRTDIKIVPVAAKLFLALSFLGSARNSSPSYLVYQKYLPLASQLSNHQFNTSRFSNSLRQIRSDISHFPMSNKHFIEARFCWLFFNSTLEVLCICQDGYNSSNVMQKEPNPCVTVDRHAMIIQNIP